MWTARRSVGVGEAKGFFSGIEADGGGGGGS